MTGQTAATAAILAVLVFDALGSAAEPEQRGGNVAINEVTVRDVQVREARVPPARRPSSAMPRPFLPDAISRPNQARFAPSDRDFATRRSRSTRSHHQSGPVGYAVGFPVYPFVFDQPTYTFYNPPPYPATVVIPPPQTLDSSAPALVAESPSFAAIDCGLMPGASAPCGGLSFDVSPADAQVSIEGIFVGAVDSFSPTRAPLVLSPGVHYVEVRRPGYRTETFEVTVGAGAIVPYRGALDPLRTR